MAGVFVNQPERVGWLLLGYSLVFATGVTCWSFALPRMTEERALRVALMAMLAVCLGLLALNHSQALQPLTRWTIGVLTAICIMIESGFTPAALSLLSGSIGAQAGRGAAMGIYSVLLSIGAILGSLLAAGLGQVFAVDGLIYGTLAMAFVAFAFVRWLSPNELLRAERPMAAFEYDLVIIGAGSGGLIAAGFAMQLGAKVALIEKDRIGGDCTWTGCTGAIKEVPDYNGCYPSCPSH